MSFSQFLKSIIGSKKETSASIAKERLKIVVSHERMKHQRGEEDFLPQLQQELIDVIAKYVTIDKNQVSVAMEQVGDRSVLELNISMPSIDASTTAETTTEA